MVNDKDLFIAIRDEYINVYYHGQSVCKLKYCKNGVKGSTHKKYLGVKETGYFTSLNGEVADKRSIIKSLCELDDIKKNVKPHKDKEKVNSYGQILDSNSQTIDVEITFSRSHEYSKSSIDYAVIKNLEHEYYIVFYEAKHFSNPEIRSKSEPKVLKQIERYKRILIDNQSEIAESYKNVCSNLSDLGLIGNRFFLNDIANGYRLNVDIEPRLIIFDCKKINGDVHMKKLQKILSDKLITK